MGFRSEVEDDEGYLGEQKGEDEEKKEDDLDEGSEIEEEKEETIWDDIDWSEDTHGEGEKTIWDDIDWSEDKHGEGEKNEDQNDEYNKEDYVENVESQSTSTVLTNNIEEIESDVEHQEQEEKIEIRSEEYQGDTNPVVNTDEIEFIKDVEKLAEHAREIKAEDENIEPQTEKENAAYYAEQYCETLKENEAINDRDSKEGQETEELRQEVTEELNGHQESGCESDKLEEEDIIKASEEIISTEEFEYLWEIRDKLDQEGKTSEEIEEVMHEAEEMYETLKNAERMIEELELEKLKLVDHEDEASEEDLKEDLDREDLIEQAVELEEKLVQQGETQEEIDVRVEESIETTKLEERLEIIIEEQEREKLKLVDHEDEASEEDLKEDLDRIDLIEQAVELEEKLVQRGESQEEIDVRVEESIETTKLEERLEILIEQQEREKLKLIDHEDEANEEDLKEDLDRVDLIEQAVELEERLVQQGESQEQIDVRVEESIEATKLEERSEKTIEKERNELKPELEAIESEFEDKKDLLEEITKLGSEESDEEENERLQELYGQETGRRPIYAKKKTKGYSQWLEQRELGSEKVKKSKSESEKIKEIREVKEEDWKTTLKQWIKEASEKECNAELKSELKKALESYNEFEALTRMFMELFEKSQHEKLSEKEKIILKSLTERLQKLDPIKLELLTSVFFIKKYITEQYWYDFWNKPLVNRVLTKFFKHISQKYKELRKESEQEEIMQNNVLLKQTNKAVPYNEFKLNKIKNNVSSIEIEELKERLKRLLNSKRKEILEGTFIPTPDNIAAIDKNFDLGDSWKKKAKNLYNVLRWWIQKNTRFKNLTELKEHYLGTPQVRDIAKDLNKFLNLKKAEILDGKFIPTLKNIKMADKKFEQLSKITRISYLIFRWLNNNTPFKSLQDLQEYHNITPENEQIKAFLNSKKQKILKGEFLPYRESFIALDNRYAKFGRFDHIVNYWIKLETPYKNITELKEKFCGMDIGKRIKKYLDSRKTDILSGKFLPTKLNLRKINPDFANYYYSDRSVMQWLNKNSNFKSIRDLIRHFLYKFSYQDLGYNSNYTLKFNEEKYRVKNAWFQVVRKIDNNRLIQIDQRKSPKTWEGLFSFLNKNNQWKFVDIITGEILEMDDRTAFHHIDGDKQNDDFFNLIFTLAANHAIITATQINWKELSEFFEDIIISNLYSIIEGQIPESWRVGWREMAVEKEFKLPKSQYIRKKEFKQKFAEIKPEFKDVSE